MVGLNPDNFFPVFDFNFVHRNLDDEKKFTSLFPCLPFLTYIFEIL